MGHREFLLQAWQTQVGHPQARGYDDQDVVAAVRYGAQGTAQLRRTNDGEQALSTAWRCVRGRCTGAAGAATGFRVAVGSDAVLGSNWAACMGHRCVNND